MTFDPTEGALWSLRDEAHCRFIDFKYADRQKLAEDWHEKRKLADKSQTIAGKPNPQYPRLIVEAEIAQTRFDMAYLVAKNQQLEQQIMMLNDLHQRVSILEGAYTYLRMLAETAKLAFESAMKTISAEPKPKGATNESSIQSRAKS